MDSLLLSIDPREPLWIGFAFACGLLVSHIGLPPLVGFLLAGFVLNAAGAEGGDFLRITADLGVTLLLFTIGLKLRVKALLPPYIWGVAILHMTLVVGLMTLFVLFLASFSLPLVSGINLQTALIIAFALTFSSTVFAVKILDQVGSSGSFYGLIAIGVLIMQDIAAVAFLAVSAGKLPSLWAFGLLALIPLRYLLFAILSRTGHGELLVLYGFVLALGGADLFELVNLKGDLGALVVGMLLAGHPKSNEMAKNLLGFKELFLVGFFLSVGMAVPPSWNAILLACLFLLVLPIKTALYFGLFAAFKLRASTSWRSSLVLANYSEFGLIVGSVSVAAGWLAAEWMAVFAILLSLSFIGAAPIIDNGERLYTLWRPRFKRMERKQRLTGEEDIQVGDVQVLVFGMGRVGSSVYDSLAVDFPGKVLGVDMDDFQVERRLAQGQQVVKGDATNPDFWSRAPDLAAKLKWVILALPRHPANLAAAERLREIGFEGRIASTSKFKDEISSLKKLGVNFVFNIYTEAGKGFAEDLKQHFNTLDKA
ncbi:MAG: cation:proton antiporter family protein [Candidatus Thiodiazotropha taylori]